MPEEKISFEAVMKIGVPTVKVTGDHMGTSWIEKVGVKIADTRFYVEAHGKFVSIVLREHNLDVVSFSIPKQRGIVLDFFTSKDPRETRIRSIIDGAGQNSN